MADQEGIEELQTRLNNILSVEPILGAMRTISLGSWQAALNRQGRVREFGQHLTELLPILVPFLTVGRQPQPEGVRRRRAKLASMSIVCLVIGSERGLCGAFNSTLILHVEAELERYEAEGAKVELATLGSRVSRGLRRNGHSIARSNPLPMTKLPTVDMAYDLVQEWLTRFEKHEVDAVDVLYNAYQNSTFYKPFTFRLIPPALPSLNRDSSPWPPPYVDTDPVTLYARLLRLWATTQMYRILLNSTAAEHSARFQLMEGATRNSSRLISELTLALQSARQQAITSEMQELAAGAGLLEGHSEQSQARNL